MKTSRTKLNKAKRNRVSTASNGVRIERTERNPVDALAYLVYAGSVCEPAQILLRQKSLAE